MRELLYKSQKNSVRGKTGRPKGGNQRGSQGSKPKGQPGGRPRYGQEPRGQAKVQLRTIVVGFRKHLIVFGEGEIVSSITSKNECISIVKSSVINKLGTSVFILADVGLTKPNHVNLLCYSLYSLLCYYCLLLIWSTQTVQRTLGLLKEQ